MYWTTKDGRKIKVVDMTDDHLRNTNAMLKKKGFVHSEIFLSCLAYASSSNTPDGAAMAAESELDHMRWGQASDAIFEEFGARGF